jgi:hypothetical protein
MYLWKCWRDSRFSVAIFLLPILFMLYGVLRHPGQGGIVNGSHASVEYLVTRVVSIAGILLLFVAWSIGGDGIGQDVAEDRGAYLLTRPRSKRFFLWTDSGFAFGLMAVLAWGTMLFFEIVVGLGLVGMRERSPLSAIAYLLIPLSGLVFAGLIYGVTYLCTVLIPRHNTARVISVAVLIAYSYLHFKAYRTWGGMTQYLFPGWWVDPFPFQHSSAVAPHVWLELAGRVIAILVLMLIAQMVLERREIRA